MPQMIKQTLCALAFLSLTAARCGAVPLTVYLVTSPRPTTGIDALGPNDFAAFTAFYRTRSGEEEPIGPQADLPLDEQSAVRVCYTTQRIPVPASWPDTRCGEFVVRLVDPTGPPSVCYLSGSWAVFLAFKQDYSWWRDFVAGFIRGFRFFLSFAQPNEVPFPAVVQVDAE
jgi:hypothetical protein